MLDLLYAFTPTVTWARAGGLPQGYQRAERFAVLSAGAGRSFMVPLTGRRTGSAAAVTSYNSLRRGPVRVARRVLGAGLRTGLAQPLLRTKVDVGVKVGTPPEALAADLLSAHLRELFGVADLAVAISGGAGPYRKPVLQCFSAGGAPLGYVKVGWNDWTRDGVRREEQALRACGSQPRKVRAPALAGMSSWHGLDLLVTAPLPRGVRGLGRAAALPSAAELRALAELSAVSSEPLGASQWWRGVRARIREKVTDQEARRTLERIADQLERSHGDIALEFGFCHGDLVPWNLARSGGQLYAWDWESSMPAAPLGFDAVHFHFQQAFVGRWLALDVAAASAARESRPPLRELGVASVSCELVTTLHLVELFLRHEEARTAAGQPDDRFYPAIASVLEQRAVRPAATASSTVGGLA